MMDDKQRSEERNREDYLKAMVGIVLAFLFALALATPILFSLIGFAVRCFRWAAGDSPFLP